MRTPRPAGAIGALLLAATVTAAAPLDEATVTRVASLLRCVVCQNLSIADSPSEMARQMRDVIRERLAQGETPQQVLDYFEQKYGAWILLSPRPTWFNRLFLWWPPFVGLGLGLVAILLAARRWTRRPGEAQEGLTPADHDRLRVELERLQD